MRSWQTQPRNITIAFGTPSMPSYTGYNWNTPVSENCDNCGRSYSSALNHRSLLYWQISDPRCSLPASSDLNQWFHGSPLTLTDSTSPYNSVQDLEFWLR